MQSDAEAGAEAHEGREVGAQHLGQVQSWVPAYETGAISFFFNMEDITQDAKAPYQRLSPPPREPQ